MHLDLGLTEGDRESAVCKRDAGELGEADRPAALSAALDRPLTKRDESYGFDKETGLWVAAVLASENELPPFAEWTARQLFPDWKQPSIPGVVWWDDGAEQWARVAGHVTRGDRAWRPTEPGRSVVAAITDVLKGQGKIAAAVGFAVVER